MTVDKTVYISQWLKCHPLKIFSILKNEYSIGKLGAGRHLFQDETTSIQYSWRSSFFPSPHVTIYSPEMLSGVIKLGIEKYLLENHFQKVDRNKKI